jgi:hypothetical protein
MPEENEVEIDSLINQLKNNTALMKPSYTNIPTLQKEEAEAFLIKNAGELIVESLGLVKDLRQTSFAAKDPEEIEAVGKLIAATASALEALNKLVIQDKKSKGAKELKQMEIDSKIDSRDKTLLTGISGDTLFLRGTREDIFKQLIKEIDITEIVSEITPIEQTETV